jgi:hypothetical protein
MGSSTSLKIGPPSPPPAWQLAVVLLTERQLLWITPPSASWHSIDLSHATITYEKVTPVNFEIHTARRTIRFRSKNAAIAQHWVATLNAAVELHTDTALLETAEHMLVDRLESRYQAPYAAAMVALDLPLTPGYRPGSKLNLSTLQLPHESHVRHCILELAQVLPDPVASAAAGSAGLAARAMQALSPAIETPSRSSSGLEPTYASRLFRLASFGSFFEPKKDGPSGSDSPMSGGYYPSNFTSPLPMSPKPITPILSASGPLATALIEARRQSRGYSTTSRLRHVSALLQAAAVAGCHELFVVATYLLMSQHIKDTVFRIQAMVGAPTQHRESLERTTPGQATKEDQPPQRRHRGRGGKTIHIDGRHESGSTTSSAQGSRLSGNNHLPVQTPGKDGSRPSQVGFSRQSTASSASSGTDPITSPGQHRLPHRSSAAIRYGLGTTATRKSFQTPPPLVPTDRRPSRSGSMSGTTNFVTPPSTTPVRLLQQFDAANAEIHMRAGRLSADDAALASVHISDEIESTSIATQSHNGLAGVHLDQVQENSPDDSPSLEHDVESSILSSGLAVPSLMRSGAEIVAGMLPASAACAGARQ